MAMMESKYYLDACYDRAFRGSYYSKAVNTWEEVEEFVWKYVQKGFNCLIIEHETGEKWCAYADDLDEAVIDPKEIISKLYKKKGN